MKIVCSHGTISFEEIIRYLALTGMFSNICSEVIKNKECTKKAKELGITVSDEQLQQFADNFRSIRGLNTTDDMNKFLKSAGLTVDDFEAFCEDTILIELLKDHIVDEDRIGEYFINNRAEFDLVRVSSIVVKEENLANEIVMQVQEDGEDFHVLARKYSVDESTRYSGGYAGTISRNLLPLEMAARVFNAAPGDLFGPFQRHGLFELILIEEVIKADMNNNEVKEALKEKIFSGWVSQFLKGGIRVNLREM